MRLSFLPLSCLLSTLACTSPFGVVPPVESSTTSPSTPPEAPTRKAMEAMRAHKPFLGRWTGTLEYRDFTSEDRVWLPTRLEVIPSRDGTSMRFVYLYEDGPMKTVREESTVSIDSTERTMTVVSGRDGSRSVYRFSDDANLLALRQKGEGVFSLSGQGVEDGQEVAVRLKLTVNRERYQLLRETQLPGEAFKFRHEYTFTRAG
ncbi:hypothetical protein [Melittangium boletus]|uniref:Lipoprotein n=1 Tax=Melittangium boletus DSM 14713 TaxID=1294270 RepID=A0A250IET8_9BACT|nr:hypothetical protein [Melittangium boletus]ATB30275.1 hypothetical protein MEBOL_003735 [Melittangium boletus DSM 14713]